MLRARVKKIASRDQTGERWILYEVEAPWGADWVVEWRSPIGSDK